MATFGFGGLVERDSRRGGRVQVPEHRLHIQSQWRIVRDGVVVVGYGDWHYPPLGSTIAYWDFQEADAARNRRDDLVDEWFAHGDRAHVVTEARGTMAGDLTILFEDGCVLETFANSATWDEDGHDEFWRLLPPPGDDGEPDFVVSAHGVDR